MNQDSTNKISTKFAIKSKAPRYLRFQINSNSRAEGSRRSRLLKQLGIKFMLVAALVLGASVLNPGNAHAASGGEIATLINQQRAANGLGSLGWNQQLANAAQAKVNDMLAKGYFSHTSPNGWTYVDFANNAGYAWQSLGENLSSGFTNSSTIVNAWMASPGHRANILGAFSEVGVGVAGSYVAAYFGTPSYVAPPPAPAPVAAPVYTAPAPKPVYRASAPVSASVSTPEAAEPTPLPTPEPAVEEPKPAPKPIATILKLDAKPSQLVAALDKKYLTGGKAEESNGFGFAILQGASAAAAALYRLVTRS